MTPKSGFRLLRFQPIFILCLALQFHQISLSSISAAEPLDRVFIAYSAISSHNAIFWISKELGLYRKYGFDVDIVLIGSGGRGLTTQAIVSGSAPLGFTSSALIISAAANGADTVIVMGVTNTLAYDIWALPSIKSPQDLKRKTFGIATYGGPSHNTTLLALRHFGLDEKRDEIKLRVIGSASARVQALVAGAIDATVVDSPLAGPLRTKNFTRLGSFQELGIPFAGNALVTTRRYIKEARRTVAAIVKATLEGIAYIHDPKNRVRVVGVLAKNMRLPQTDAELAYRDYLVPMVELRPYPDMQALQSTIDILSVTSPKVGAIKPDDIVDLSFLKSIESTDYPKGLDQR